jgi:hypothetical protein
MLKFRSFLGDLGQTIQGIIRFSFDKGTMQSARCWYFGRAIISPILSTRTQIGSNLWEIKPLVSKWFRHCGRRPIYTRGRLLDNQIGRRFGPILRRGCGHMIWFCSCQHERLWFGCSRTIKITPKIRTSKAAARNSCPKSMVWNEKKTLILLSAPGGAKTALWPPYDHNIAVANRIPIG